MSDEKLRALGRRVAGEDPEARPRFIREAVRTGILPANALDLVTHLLAARPSGDVAPVAVEPRVLVETFARKLEIENLDAYVAMTGTGTSACSRPASHGVRRLT
jgi:hypothetical protein